MAEQQSERLESLVGTEHVVDVASGAVEQNGMKVYALSDTGNAERFVSQHKHLVRYCSTWGKWLLWDGQRWSTEDQSRLFRLAKRTVRDIYKEAAGYSDPDQRKAVAKWALRSEFFRPIKSMLALAQHELGVQVAATDLDADPWLFNCDNGTIDLRTGKLRKHAQRDMLTKMSPVCFDREAECPVFMRFIRETTQTDQSLQLHLQRLLGIALTGDISEQIMPVWYGEGSNGKSTLVDVVLLILGDYGTTAPPELLVAKKWSQHPTEIADLAGKRFVAASETERGQTLRVQFVKQTTGDAKLKGRFMRQDFFEFDRTHKTVLITNNKPAVPEDTHAIWRRLQLVPFLNRVPKDEQDTHLPEKLGREVPGILAWMVRGCLDWQQHGIEPPEAIKEATADYQAEADLIGNFIDECLTITAGSGLGFAPSSRIIECFDRWCVEEGADCRKPDLWARLRKLGARPGHDSSGTKRGWYGVLIRLEEEQAGHYTVRD